MKTVLHLVSVDSAHTAISELWKTLRPYLMDGDRFEVEVRPERRTSEASARFHAICTDLERSRFPWFGKPRIKSEWKVLLISGHAIATKRGADVIPGIEGEFVNIREESSKMSGARMASLVEYSEAFCIEKGVKLRDPQSLEAA